MELDDIVKVNINKPRALSFSKTIQNVNQIAARFQNWIDEYYVPVEDCTGSNIEALKQGIKKWSGFLPENFNVFGINYDHMRSFMEARACALCHMYMRDEDGESFCTSCPLELSGHGCDSEGSLWQLASHDYKPQPLIDKLKELLVEEEAKELKNS